MRVGRKHTIEGLVAEQSNIGGHGVDPRHGGVRMVSSVVRWERDVATFRASGLRDSVGLVAVVCLAYYVGTLVGLQLRLPPATPSVLWPPNAILATALLFTPPRLWALVLLAALPAHLWLQLDTF